MTGIVPIWLPSDTDRVCKLWWPSLQSVPRSLVHLGTRQNSSAALSTTHITHLHTSTSNIQQPAKPMAICWGLETQRFIVSLRLEFFWRKAMESSRFAWWGFGWKQRNLYTVSAECSPLSGNLYRTQPPMAQSYPERLRMPPTVPSEICKANPALCWRSQFCDLVLPSWSHQGMDHGHWWCWTMGQHFVETLGLFWGTKAHQESFIATAC